MFEKVKEIISENLGIDPETITETAAFKEDLGIDSLDLFELVMSFEEEFNISIPTEELEKMKNVGDVAAYIEKNQK